MKKKIIISSLISLIIGLGIIGLLSSNGKENGSVAVSLVDGIQIIEISAKGGFSPNTIKAEAGLPSTLRVKTSGTYDCSSSLAIPKLGYFDFLPSSGVEEIQISPEEAQGTLQGLCSMGMYDFKIVFE